MSTYIKVPKHLTSSPNFLNIIQYFLQNHVDRDKQTNGCISRTPCLEEVTIKGTIPATMVWVQWCSECLTGSAVLNEITEHISHCSNS